MNLSTVKWAQWDKTQCRELLGLFIWVCIALCTTVAHNIAQNRPDNFPPYPPDNHHCSDDVYLREGANQPTMCRSHFKSQCISCRCVTICLSLSVHLSVTSWCSTETAKCRITKKLCKTEMGSPPTKAPNAGWQFEMWSVVNLARSQVYHTERP